MKRLRRKITVLLVLVALVFGATSCTKQGTSGKPSNVDYWTCTMHPSVHAKDPGKCPICSMDLVPVMKKGSEARTSPSSGKPSNVDYWTCTMHPSVHAKDPGKCPICSMDL